MTLQQLRYFLAAVKHKSFSKAADALFVSQPALSKQIATLENHLGFALFERTPRMLELTELGARFYKRIQPLILELDGIVDEFRQPDAWTIGTLPSLAAFYLPTLLPSMGANADIKLTTRVINTSDELLELAQSGELDAVIVQDRYDYGSLKTHFLFSEPYYVAMPHDHPLAQQPEVSMDDLDGEPIIMHAPPCDINDFLLTAFDRHDIRPHVRADAPLNDSLLSYTASGAGLTFVPAMMVQNVTHPRVLYKPIHSNPLRRDITLFARSQRVIDWFASQQEQ